MNALMELVKSLAEMQTAMHDAREYYESLLPDRVKKAGAARSGRGEYKKRELRGFVRHGKPWRVCAVMRREGTTPEMQKALSVAAVHLGLLPEDVSAAALYRAFSQSGAAEVASARAIGRAIRAYLAESSADTDRLQMPRVGGVPDAVMRKAWDALAQFDCGAEYGKG